MSRCTRSREAETMVALDQRTDGERTQDVSDHSHTRHE